ncbi:MAG: hypothetical protein ACI8TP_000262 [Acidimicrobiales bacterium]
MSDQPEPLDVPAIDLDALLQPDEQSRFRRLCLATSSEELLELDDVVAMHLDQVKQMADHRTDLETAEEIATALHSLLSLEVVFGDDERTLVRGAVEYFLLMDDADGDISDVLGFDDDARVLNSVLDRIGQPQLKVTFD